MISLSKTLFTFLFIFNIFCVNANDKNPQMKSLVDVNWLNNHLNDKNLVILDASVVISFNEEDQFSMLTGKNQYVDNHIPGARFADLLGDLSATSTNLHFVMPSPQQFQKAINNLGVSNDSRVVIYSTKPSQSWAERLWWMLYWAGHDNVAILDGGFNAWVEAGFPVSNMSVNQIKTDFKLNPRNQTIADRDEVYKAVNDKNITIIDVLSEASYTGDFSMYARPGHIKSAINIPTKNLVTESGHYKTTDELKTLFKSNQDDRIITYCGGGVAASSTAFTLHRLGYKNIAVYMGSLQEWAVNNQNPMSIEH